MLRLAEFGHVIYQIEGIDKTITLEQFSSKLVDSIIQDGRQKVKMVTPLLEISNVSSHEWLDLYWPNFTVMVLG